MVNRDVLDIPYRMAGNPAIFYYLVPVPDLREMLNGTGYRNWIFYWQYNSIKA